MKTASAKAKGRRCAQELKDQVCAVLEISTEDIQVTPSGVNGPDLWLSKEAKKKFPFAVECKNVELLNIWAAMNQAKNHIEAMKDFPLLVFTRNRHDTYVAMTLKDFLQIIRKAYGSKRNAKGGRNVDHLGSDQAEFETQGD